MVPDVVKVSLEALTRFYLQNHFLADRASKEEIINVVSSVCGLHSQLPNTPYYSLLNRIKDFKPEMLERALYKDKSLVKTWFMRGTLHVIPSQELPIYNRALRRMWFEHHGRYMNKPDWPTRKEREEKLYPGIKEALAEKPLSRKELSDSARLSLTKEANPYDRLFSAWGGILKETSYLGITVHAEPSGRESSFARLDKWLPEVSLEGIDEEKARQELLRKYLRGYGPASAQDFACWSGMLTSEARQVIEKSKDLKSVQLENRGRELWMLKDDFATLERIDLEADVPSRLLPKYDSYVLGHKDRSRIIRDALLQKVYRPVVGEVAATVIANGRIVGTWTSKKTTRTLRIFVKRLEKLDVETYDGLEFAAKELACFAGTEMVQVVPS